jgi:hypothetical protein
VGASLAELGSADGAFPLGHCFSRTCRRPAGSHRSCSSGDCRHRDNVCASTPHNNGKPGLLMSGLGHLRWERSYADADSNKLFHPSERCVETASWHKPRQASAASQIAPAQREYAGLRRHDRGHRHPSDSDAMCSEMSGSVRAGSAGAREKSSARFRRNAGGAMRHYVNPMMIAFDINPRIARLCARAGRLQLGT